MIRSRRRRGRIVVPGPRWRLGLALLVLSGFAPPDVRAQAAAASGAPDVIPGQPFLGFGTTDSLGRQIRYYLSEPEGDTRLPLVLYVQGSGAGSLFQRSPQGRIFGAMGQSTVRDAFAGAARVLVVEKPGVSYLDESRPVSEASPAFHREHTLERWAVALRAAIGAACAREDVACEDGVLVIGHSEGGVAAARVAATSPAVTHVAVLAGEGPSQLYSLLILARDGVFFERNGEDAASRQAYLLGQWNEILRDPDAADRFFFGHPYRRWSSFLSTSPAKELEKAEARIFIAQGTADRAVAPSAAEVLFATLAAGGHDVCYARVEGANHSFALPDRDGWLDIMQDARTWFLGGGETRTPLLCSGAER